MHVWLYGQEWGAVVSVSVEMEEDQLTPTLVGLLSEAGRPGIGCVARIQLRLEPKMPGCWSAGVLSPNFDAVVAVVRRVGAGMRFAAGSRFPGVQ